MKMNHLAAGNNGGKLPIGAGADQDQERAGGRFF
jgi:hypothetical protein